MTNTSKKTAVRIMAWILAILMILSLATVAISVFADSCDTAEEVPHDHNGDGVPDHDDDGHTEDGSVTGDEDADIGDDIFDDHDHDH